VRVGRGKKGREERRPEGVAWRKFCCTDGYANMSRCSAMQRRMSQQSRCIIDQRLRFLFTAALGFWV
jgi:hypothetical protein